MTATTGALVLAGGRSHRYDVTGLRPKALAPVGDLTMLGEVIQRHGAAGMTRVVVALGHHPDRIADGLGAIGMGPGEWSAHLDGVEVVLIATDPPLDTAGRIDAVRDRLPSTFLLSWCDGLLDVDLAELLRDHNESDAVVTAVVAHPSTKFGRVWIDQDGRVTEVREKPLLDDVWVSAGVFVVDGAALAQVQAGTDSWERDVLPRLVDEGVLRAHRHEGFWAAVDTPGDLEHLHALVGDEQPWRAIRP